MPPLHQPLPVGEKLEGESLSPASGNVRQRANRPLSEACFVCAGRREWLDISHEAGGRIVVARGVCPTCKGTGKFNPYQRLRPR